MDLAVPEGNGENMIDHVLINDMRVIKNIYSLSLTQVKIFQNFEKHD